MRGSDDRVYGVLDSSRDRVVQWIDERQRSVPVTDAWTVGRKRYTSYAAAEAAMERAEDRWQAGAWRKTHSGRAWAGIFRGGRKRR